LFFFLPGLPMNHNFSYFFLLVAIIIGMNHNAWLNSFLTIAFHWLSSTWFQVLISNHSTFISHISFFNILLLFLLMKDSCLLCSNYYHQPNNSQIYIFSHGHITSFQCCISTLYIAI
jgi:hypothetical protein